MTGRKTEDVPIEGAGPVFEDPGEVIRHSHRVEAARNFPRAEERLDLGGEDQGPGRLVIVERLDAAMIARAKERLPALVPDGKGKIAQESFRRVFAPLLVRAKDQLAVGDLAVRPLGESERGDELIAVVDPGVGGDDQVALLAGQGQLLVEGFRRRPEHPMSQTNRPDVPHAGTVRAPVGEAFGHPLQIGAVDGLAVPAVEPDDGAHRVCASSASSGV